MASATFDFSHPSNFSVNHPASPVTEGLSQGDGERLVPDSALSNRSLPAFGGARYPLFAHRNRMARQVIRSWLPSQQIRSSSS